MSLMRFAILFATLLGAGAAAAQPFEARVYLDDVPELDVTIDEVTSFGFYFDGGQGMLYRQIDSLRTEDVELTQRIQAFVPSAEVVAAGRAYVVRLDASAIPRHTRSPRRPLIENLDVLVGMAGGHRVGGSASLHASPRGLGPVYLSLLSTMGWSLDSGTYLAGMGVGMGVRVERSQYAITAEVGVWERFSQSGNDHVVVTGEAVNRSLDALSLAARLEHLLGERFHLVAGARYFLTDLETRFDEQPISGFVGIRYAVVTL